MIDRSNLNRIKGVLSAHQGAEIPKFLGGAKFAKEKNGKIIYSTDGASWFTDLNLQFPHLGSLDGFYDVSTPDVPQEFEIPGDPHMTPSTAVETSAQVNRQVQQQQTTAAAEQTFKQPKLESINPGPLSINETPMPKLDGTDIKGIIQKDSVGINLLKQKEVEQALTHKSNLMNVGQAGAQAFSALGDAIGQKQAMTDSNLTKTADTAYDGIANVAQNFGPIGKAVGSVMKIASAAGDMIQELGGGTDQQTKMDKWMDSSFFSWNIGMLNGFAGKNSDSFGVDRDILEKVGSSYGGTTTDLNEAANSAGKKYGLFSSKARKKANAAIATAKNQQNAMGTIADTASDQRLAAQSMGEQAGLAYSMMIDGGYNQKYTYAAKHGGIIDWSPVPTLEWELPVVINWELPNFKEGGAITTSDEIVWKLPKFKDGGKTEDLKIPEIEETAQKNVIPEGALHKNKHHMEHAEGLTKKGIPVIDDEGEQQAEIEHSEIIFTLEVTKKLEEYYETFYSDESSNKEKEQAALEAGQLLVYQILENTEDRTGLIEVCKEGGSLTLKKSTDVLIKEVSEDVVILVEETKPKEQTEKEKMKEVIKEVIIELLLK